MSTFDLPNLDTFVLIGPIEEIHTSGRRVRIAGHDLDVMFPEQLAHCRVGNPAVAHVGRDRLTYRQQVVAIISPRIPIVPTTRRTVKRVIDSAVRIARSQDILRESHSAVRPQGMRMWQGPRCIRCEGPVFPASPTVADGDSRAHVICPTTL